MTASIYSGYLYDFLLGFDTTFAAFALILVYMLCNHHHTIHTLLAAPTRDEKFLQELEEIVVKLEAEVKKQELELEASQIRLPALDSPV